MLSIQRSLTAGLFAIAALLTSEACGQSIDDWLVFPDPVSGATCDVVNASNAELIVLTSTGEMAVVSGADIILSDLVVNQNNEVAFEGAPFGILSYAEDRQGLPALFWTTLTGSVVGINTFTGEPFDSGQLPEDFQTTACDACNFVDSSPICDGPVDGGGDGGDDGGFDGPLFPLLCGSFGLPATLMMVAGLAGLRLHSTRRSKPAK